MLQGTSENYSSRPILQLHDAGHHSLNRTREVDYFLEMTLDEARVMLKARTANLIYYSPEGQLKAFYADENPEEVYRIAEFVLHYTTGLNLLSGESQQFTDENGKAQSISVSVPTLCTALQTGEGKIGAIIVRNPIYFQQFFESDSLLIESLSSAFSTILLNGWLDQSSANLFFSFRSGLLLLLENAHLHQKIKDADDRLKAILEVSNLINSSRELNEMISTVLYSARKVIRAESATVFLVDENTGELYFDIVSGHKEGELTGIRIPPGKGIVGRAAQEMRTIMVNDPQNDPSFYGAVDKMSQHQTRNLLAAPLIVDGNVIGVVEVLNTIDRASFTDHDQELFQSFSDSVAIALQRRMLIDDLQYSNEQLEKKLREVTSLHSVAATLVESKSIEELFNRVLKIITTDMQVSRASMLLYNASTEKLEVVAREGNYNETGELEHQEHKLSTHVFLSGRSVFTNALSDEYDVGNLSSPEAYRTNASIMIPFTSREKNPYGVICVSDPHSGRFSDEDYRMLTTIASQMVRGYENFKLNEEILAKQAMEKEVEITSRIQQNILPEAIPDHAHMDLGARSVMARTIGGDFYDFYNHSTNGDAVMLVADVSGKSLPAALFMALSSSILRTIIRSEDEPTRILSLANELLYEESHSGMFVTVFLARFEPRTSMLRYASAGHNEMILMHPDGTYDILSGKGAPLGVVPHGRQRFVGGELLVQDDDLLVLYTDGVIEAVNQENEEFGLARFLHLLKDNLDAPPQEIIDIVYDNVVQYSGTDLQYDDFTMVITRFHSLVRTPGEYRIVLPAVVESVPVLRDFLHDLCVKHGIEGQVRDDILLSADEAATNIVIHAYRDVEPENHCFECNVHIEYDDLFRFQFVDNGKQFDINSVQQPDLNENLTGRRKGGFGIYLIRSLMDQCSYTREEGKNFFVAEKRLKSGV